MKPQSAKNDFPFLLGVFDDHDPRTLLRSIATRGALFGNHALAQGDLFGLGTNVEGEDRFDDEQRDQKPYGWNQDFEGKNPLVS